MTEQELRQKLLKLNEKSIKKILDFYNQTKSLMMSIDQDLKDLQQESNEINIQLQGLKKKDTPIKPKK